METFGERQGEALLECSSSRLLTVFLLLNVECLVGRWLVQMVSREAVITTISHLHHHQITIAAKCHQRSRSDCAAAEDWPASSAAAGRRPSPAMAGHRRAVPESDALVVLHWRPGCPLHHFLHLVHHRRAAGNQRAVDRGRGAARGRRNLK